MRRRKIGTPIAVVVCTLALAFGLTAAGVGGASNGSLAGPDAAAADGFQQSTTLEWENRYPDSSAGIAATHRADGATLAAGERNGDGWLVRFDERGETVWETTVEPGTSDDRDAGHFDAIVPAADGYLLVGSVYLTAEDETVAWAAKVSDSGELRWERTYRGNEWSERLSDGVRTADGGFLLAGMRNVSSPDTGQAWLLRIDGAGDPQWERTYGDADRTEFTAVAPADDGYLAAGVTNDVGGTTGAWAVNVDDDGAVNWQQEYADASPEPISDVVRTDDGHLLATESGWLAELDARGSTQWEANHGFAIADATPTDDGYVLTGWNYQEGVAMGVDADGETRWRWTRGGDRAYGFKSAVQTGDGSYLIGGFVDGDARTGWAGEIDVTSETTTTETTTTGTESPAPPESTETTESDEPTVTTDLAGETDTTTESTPTPTPTPTPAETTDTTESGGGGGDGSDADQGGDGSAGDGADADSPDEGTIETTDTTTAEAAATSTAADEEPATTETEGAANDSTAETTVFESADEADSRGQPGFGVAAAIVGLVFIALAAIAVFVRQRG